MTTETQIIYWMVVQHLADNHGYVDSKFITADADAIRYLADKGMVVVEQDAGGRIISGHVKGIWDEEE